jgi:hypothetical protein
MLKQTKTEEDIKALFENAVRKMDGTRSISGTAKKRLGRRNDKSSTWVASSPHADEDEENKKNLTDTI